jgi:hypothetical protein
MLDAVMIADVGFGSFLIRPARCCLDSGGGYTHRAPTQAGRSVFLQKFLNDTLGLAIFALPEVVMTDSSFPIDEEIRDASDHLCVRRNLSMCCAGAVAISRRLANDANADSGVDEVAAVLRAAGSGDQYLSEGDAAARRVGGR